ncbi:uncharacterized protein LOC114430572 [Parambassis ranga]|uniref:Uncharacterized protein LOC114430572 n=1 Tax=Parambassis ranga TaxID=210632 RepID=A0A6P7HKH1_9TELE|nr:uncharacterized protein LOC114430572 [Parambassis ranga]
MSTWRTIDEQMSKMLSRCRGQAGPDNKKRAAADMQAAVCAALIEQGVKGDDRKPLKSVIATAENNIKLKRDKNEEKRRTVSVLEKIKWKKAAKADEEKRKILYQAYLCCLDEDCKELDTTTDTKQEVESEGTQGAEIPPPYSPASMVAAAPPQPPPQAPSLGMYPIITITDGRVEVTDRQTGQSLLGSVQRPGGNPQASPIQLSSTPLPQDAFLWRSLQEAGSPKPVTPQHSEHTTRASSPDLSCGSYTSLPQTSSTRNKTGRGRQVVVTSQLAGEVIDTDDDDNVDMVNGNSSAHTNTTGLLQQIDQTIVEVQRQMSKSDLPRRHTMTLRSHTQQDKQTQPTETVSQFPLVQAGSFLRYKPYSVGDVNTLVEKMPPPSEGGGLWMDKLAEMTAGQTLALGDFRAIASRMMLRSELHEIETQSGTVGHGDNERFTTYSTCIGFAMRELFPLPVSTGPPKYTWDPAVPPREHLVKCREDWTRKTGMNPSQQGVQQQWFRKAVEEGLPVSVQQALNNNPDLPGSASNVWERHVTHHMEQHKMKTDQENVELKGIQAQLLKLQLGQARKDVTEQRKGKKDTPAVQMVVQPQSTPPPQPQPPVADNYSTPPWVSPPFNRRGWGQNRRGGNWRGRGSRGGGGRGRGGNMWGRLGSCFHCGEPGHWERDCPYKVEYSRRPQGAPWYPSQGNGGPGPQQLGPPPPGQYPSMPWGGEGPHLA